MKLANSSLRLVSILAALVLAVGAHRAAAEPVAVVSVAGVDSLMADVEYLFEATGTGQFAQLFLPTVKNYFKGLDTTQPFGLVISVVDNEFTPLGFVPVTDLKAFLSQLEAQIGEPTERDNGILEIEGGPQPIFVKQVEGWAFVGQTAESLADVPKAPTNLLDGLNEKYDLAVRAYVNNIPEQFRQLALQQIDSGLRQGLENSNSDPEARQLAEAQVAQLSRMIQEAGQVTIGWTIDTNGRSTYLDISVQAQPNTSLAQQFKAATDVTTNFAGFIAQDAAITANLTSVIAEDQIAQSISAIDNIEKSALREIENDADLDEAAARDAAKQLLQNFFAILRSTMKTGRLDSAVSVILKPKSMTLVSAAHVASGSEVESAIKQLVALAESEPDISFSKIQFNSTNHRNVRFHSLSIPIPEEEYVRQVLGDELNIVLGVADSSVFVALGSDGEAHLKSMIDASQANLSQSIEPFQLSVALAPILEFAASIEENPIVSGLASTLAQSNGKDHLRIRTLPITDGVTYRLQIEEGVLRTIGMGAQIGAAGGF